MFPQKGIKDFLLNNHLFAKEIDKYKIIIKNVGEASKKNYEKYSKLVLSKKWELAGNENSFGKLEETDSSAVTWPAILDVTNIPNQGDKIMQRLQFLLGNIPEIKRVEYQIQFHQEIILTCLPIIYKNEWDSQSSIILKKYGVTKYRPEVFFITPRRFGKTTSCVAFCCAALYAIPNISINIFSTCKNIAGKMKNQILKHLRMMPKFDEFIATKNQNDIELKFGLHDSRTVSCYASLVKVFFLLVLFFPVSKKKAVGENKRKEWNKDSGKGVCLINFFSKKLKKCIKF
jgi:hypothetical protein